MFFLGEGERGGGGGEETEPLATKLTQNSRS